MAIVLTYWEDPRVKHTEDDFDGMFSVQLKRVSQVHELVAARPKKCTMISLERSAEVKLASGKTTKYFKEVWRKGDPVPEMKLKACPLCHRAYEVKGA